MSLVSSGGQVVMYSPIPYGPYVYEALEMLSAADIAYIVSVNVEHNLCAKSYLEKFPRAKIVSGEGIDLGGCQATFQLTEGSGNTVIGAPEFRVLFGDPWVNSILLVYLNHHHFKEIVMFDSESRILFEADVVFNVAAADSTGTFEQYSPATGYSEQYNPFTGWSYLVALLTPGGYLSNYFHSWHNKTNTEGGKEGIILLYGLDFDRIVPCHGNIIEDGKGLFRQVFPDLLPWRLP